MSSINTILAASGTVNGADALKLAAIREVYAMEIEFQAMPLMHFFRFATYREELGTQAGLTINIPTYKNAGIGSKLTETDRIATKGMSIYNKTVTVTEWADAYAFTELALQAAFTNVMADAVTHLARSYALTMDCYLRDVAMAGATIEGVTTPVIYGRANSAAAKIATRSAITTASPLSTATIKDGLELLATNNVPRFESAYFICACHPHQSRALRDDTYWIDVSKYAAPEQMLTGEIGKIDNVRFIETTLMPNGAVASTDLAYKAALVHGASGAPASVDVYQAILMGENYYGLAVALPVELRDDGVDDFGRNHAVAWYSIFGAAVLNPENAVIIETN